jgi:hypothetical protein
MCRQALREYLLVHAAEQAQHVRELVLNCRVCDPAAGEGALLAAMLEEMLALLGTLRPGSTNHPDDLRRHILANCLFGVDVAEEAVRACRRRLSQAARHGDRPPPDLSRQIVCGDSLLGPGKQPAFDIVLANPPYVSFGLRGNPAARKAWAAAIRERYPRSAEYKLSTYAVFMDRCLLLTRPGGVCCCITPDSYLLGRYFCKLRRRILDDCAIRAFFLIEEDFWKGAVVGRPVIGLFSPGGRQAELTATRSRTAGDLTAGRVEAHAYPQSYFEGLSRNRFRLLFSQEDRRFVDVLERDARRLGDVMSFASGLIGKHGRNALVAGRRRGPTWRRGIDSGATSCRTGCATAGSTSTSPRTSSSPGSAMLAMTSRNCCYGRLATD